MKGMSFCKWEEEVLNKIEDRDILLEFVPAEKQADFLHNFADVLFTFEQRSFSQAIREVQEKLEIAKGCMKFKGFVCKKTNCELNLCPLNIHFRVEKFGVK